MEVQVGVLSGVEPLLLEQAFQFAQAGTIAEQAVLMTEVVSPARRLPLLRRGDGGKRQ